MGKHAARLKRNPSGATGQVAAAKAARPPIPSWVLAAMLGLMTVALYWPALHHQFLNYDDQLYVTGNSHVQAGLTAEGLRWAFFEPEADFGYWHPLTLMSHMLDCQMFGLKPWGHHLTNVLLHAANVALVFLLLLRLTGATWRSLTVAALFATHPLHVESVAWIAERKDVLSTFFGLLSLLAYVGYVRKREMISVGEGSRRREGADSSGKLMPNHPPRYLGGYKRAMGAYVLSLLLFALGLLCKPMLVTVPFVMLLLDGWPLGRFSIYDFRFTSLRSFTSPATRHPSPFLEKIPFFVLAVIASIVTYMISKKGGVLTSGQTLSMGARFANALISYCRYLGKLFWPAKLAVFYPYPGHWPAAAVVAGGALLLAITALCLLVRRGCPFVLMGWLWFTGTLVPVIGLVPVGEHAMADRYAYIPSIGFFIAVVWGLCALIQKWPFRMVVLPAAGAAAIVACAWVTRAQLGYWQNDETLFAHALQVTRDNYLAHKGLGDALDARGDYDGAMKEFQSALALRPAFAGAHGGLGIVLAEKGRLAEAIDQYRAALRLKPDDFEARCNLGNALLATGQMVEAMDELQKAVRLKPDVADAHYDLGVVYGSEGDMDKAITEFQEALRLNPNLAAAYNNLGTAYYKLGRITEAIDNYQKAVGLKPDFDMARENLARALATTNTPAAQ